MFTIPNRMKTNQKFVLLKIMEFYFASNPKYFGIPQTRIVNICINVIPFHFEILLGLILEKFPNLNCIINKSKI